MIITLLAQAPDYSYHMPWYFKLRIVIIVGGLLIAAGKALTSGKSASAPPMPSTPFSSAPKPVPRAADPTQSRPTEPFVEVPNVPPILVFKNEQQSGPYTLEEVQGRLSTGAFAPTDLGWHEGLSDWQPLSSIPGVSSWPMPGRLPPAPPSHHPAVSSTTDAVGTPASSANGLLIGGYICAGLSLLFLPPFLGLAGVICGVFVVKRQEVNKGVTLLIVSFICAALGMMIGAAS